MRSDLTAATLLSILLWSMLSLSLFAAPANMAGRGSEDAAHTAELIRQHRERISPPSMPAAEEEYFETLICSQLPDDPAMSDEVVLICDAEPDTPVFRPAGARPKFIQVCRGCDATPAPLRAPGPGRRGKHEHHNRRTV